MHWSITGKCNFNCRHCLVSAPNAHHPQLPLSDCLHIVEEIAKCGVNRVDVTGGEPLVRRNIVDLVRMVASVPGVDEVDMTTNATLLAPVAAKLRAAGLIVSRREGKEVYYRAADTSLVRELHATIEHVAQISCPE